MLKKAAFSPAQPRRGETRRSAGKAAASKEARRYIPHFVWAVRPCNGSWRTEKPPTFPTSQKLLLNVKPLSEARTPLADFFSFLLGFPSRVGRGAGPLARTQWRGADPESRDRAYLTASIGTQGIAVEGTSCDCPRFLKQAVREPEPCRGRRLITFARATEPYRFREAPCACVCQSHQ